MSADLNRQFLEMEGSHQRQEEAGLGGNAGLAGRSRTALGPTVSTLLFPTPAAGAEGIGVSGEEAQLLCAGGLASHGLKGRNKPSPLEKAVWYLPFKKKSHIFYLCILCDSGLRNLGWA